MIKEAELYVDKIPEEDIAQLCAINPLASEQLRRIVAERQRDELAQRMTAPNGAVKVDIGAETGAT